MRQKQFWVNATVLALSVSLALVVCELGARTLLDPADYLSPTMVKDDILGVRVAAGSARFDEWGFRNKKVPSTIDMVAIGDSHTYGNNATINDSWPSVAGRLTGLSTYNLGLGGYGPNQYYHLFKTRALSLKPKWILCGLYMGDDFENAFLMTYGLDYWSHLRRGGFGEIDPDIWDTAEAISWHKPVRDWLSRNSVMYRLAVHGPLLGRLKGAFQIRQATHDRDQSVTSLAVANEGILEAFRPVALRSRLDPNSPAIQEGMRITFRLLQRMNETAQKSNLRFAIVLIPTKETVFAEYLLKDQNIHLKKEIRELIGFESDVKRQLVEFLNSADIQYVDTLPALRSHVTNHLYTVSDGDMHPAKNGYHVIGQVVAEYLNK